MTRYNKSMREVLFQIREGYSPKEIKMAIGIANDPRYKGGNYDGAVDAIEKIKKGLSNHKQVAAVLKRLNTGFDPEIAEELELDELKMDDPKLVKAFDKMKKGDTIKLKTSSTISKGADFVDYVVKAKNVVNKGRVEKITLVTKGNEKAVKKFLYKRDGKVTFAIGDMGASIDDIKEGTWALPDSPKAKAELKKLMSKPIKLGKEGDEAADKLYSLIGDDELFDDLYVAGKKNPNGDARDVVKKHMKRLGIKEEVELQEKVSKDMALKILSMMKNQKFVKVSGDFVPEIYLSGGERDELKKEFGRLPRGLPNASNGVPVVTFINYALGLDNEIDTEDGDKPQPKLYDYRKGKVIGKPKTVGDAAKMAGLRLEEVELEEKLKVSDGLGAWIDDFKKSDAPQFKGKSDEEKKNMAIAAFTDAGGKLDEGMKYTHAAVDKKGLVIGFASDEKDAKDMAKRNDGKVVKLKKPMPDKKGDMMVNRPLKEEEPDKPDTAKAVDQMRDDKKKTRIAQLQLQIAKATEMINKLNAQEKPSE